MALWRKIRSCGFELIVLGSQFVPGGYLWDKVRALFIHGAEVRFPEVSEGDYAAGNIS